MNFQNPVMRDKRCVKRWIALDRESIAYKIRRIGELPAYSMLPPGVANYPGGAALDFKSLSYADRIKKAQSLMTEMGYGPNKHLQLDYLTSTNPDSTRSASVIQRMLTKIYNNMKLPIPSKAKSCIAPAARDFEIGAAAWIAGTMTPAIFSICNADSVAIPVPIAIPPTTRCSIRRSCRPTSNCAVN